MKTEFHSIVLGLGGVGAGAAYWLARRLGGDVLGLEQFELFHVRGESHDHSRIIRHSYHRPEYVEFTRAAYAAWATLEADLGEKLIVKTGGLDLGPRENAAIKLDDYAAAMTACEVPFEQLDAREIMRRYPQFKLDESIAGLFQADGGIAPADKCNAAHVRMARAHGAILRDNAPVSAIYDDGRAIRVTAGGVTYSAQKLVIAAGPWSNGALAHVGMKLPLTINREQVLYFDSPHKREFAQDRFPVWIWMDEPCFYGFPLYGEDAVKVAEDCGGYATTADSRNFEPDDANTARVTNFLQRYLPSALGPLHLLKTCLYTLTPDRDFVVDTLPGHPNISMAIGAGHAFKFASAIGRVLSELALDGTSASDLSLFKIDREILTLENPPVNFMT